MGSQRLAMEHDEVCLRTHNTIESEGRHASILFMDVRAAIIRGNRPLHITAAGGLH
jgi:hypothetical protein